MAGTVVKCTNCGQEFEVSEVLKHQIEEKVLADLKNQHQEELSRKDEELKKAREMELDIRKQKNALDEQKKTFELDKQRQLDAERSKIIASTTEQILEQQRLREKEKDKVIDDLKRSLEDAQRRATQGSQQLQGEVQELDLEQSLRQSFPADSIEPIEKGVLGADIRQRVRSPLGRDCGSILWESKRTKAWSDGWIIKLKEDLRNDKAHLPVIVSETLPDIAKHGMGCIDGVWVVGPVPDLIITLATLLRKILLDAAKQKMVSEAKQSKAEEVYEFITSHEFSQQVESMVQAYAEMKNEIGRERTVYEKLWKQREAQIDKLLTGVSGVYGSIQGIAGNAVPQIGTLEIESLNK